MNSIEREYVYRPKWTLIVLGAAFFGLSAVVLAFKAAANRRGLIINGVIELGPEGATAFFWTTAAGSAGFVGMAALLAYYRITFQQRLVFGPAAMTVPISRWSREVKEIAYRDIATLSEATINGQQFLYIVHPGGKYTITDTMLPSRAAFTEVCELLVAKPQQAWLAGQSHAQACSSPQGEVSPPSGS